MTEDWITCRVKDLSKYELGGDWGKSPDFEDKDYVLVACIRGTEFKNWDLDKGSTAVLRKIKRNSLEKRILREGDILVEISGGGPEQPVGRTELISKSVFNRSPNENVVYTNFLRLLRPTQLIIPQYLNLFLKYFYSTGEIIKYQGGSNNLRNLKFPDFLTIAVPLAPLPIQRAIVVKIEELFSSLDSGIADLKKVQEQLKVYRQAVLKKAFEGEYELFSLGKIAKWGSGGTPSRRNEEFFKGEIPWLKTGELGSKFVEDAEEKITPEAIRKSSAKIFPSGSVGIAMYGATIGKCSIFKAPLSTNQACAVAQPSELITSEFLYYYLISQKHDFIQKGIGGAQPNISQTILKAHPIPLPTLDTQEKIVKDLESLISNCEALENSIEGVLNNSKALRQSILKKAFEGKLLSEEEIEKCKKEYDYEPADVLLQKIKAEKKKK